MTSRGLLSLRTQTYFRLSLHFAEVKRQPEIRLRSQAMGSCTFTQLFFEASVSGS